MGMTALCVYRNVKSAESFPNRPLRTELHSAASSTESAGTAGNDPQGNDNPPCGEMLGKAFLERRCAPRSPRLCDPRSFGISVCFNIGSSGAVPLTAVVFRRLCTRKGPSCLDIADGGHTPQ